MREAGKLLLAIVLVIPLLAGCREKASRANGKRVVVIGFDGMDPRLVRRLMDEGKMPNFSKLAAEGGLWDLGTSIPPQSPVAWSNFIVGGDPGAHGVFDFIHRRFTDEGTVEPFFSTNETVEGDPPLELGCYKVPMPWQKKGELLLKRGGTPFWDYLDERGIPSRLYRVPANYPPSRSKRGYTKALSGMGTTDLLGTQGTFQWFSTEFDADMPEEEGGIPLPLEFDPEKNAYVARLKGIQNPMRACSPDPDNPESLVMRLPIYIQPDRTEDIARIFYTNGSFLGLTDERIEFTLRVGEWSDWKPVVFLPDRFDPSSGAGSRGIVRFLLRKAHDPELYVSSINFDPANPSAKITEPDSFAGELAKRFGPFATVGFAEDFHARQAEARIGFDEYAYELTLFDDEDYRQQTQFIFDERKRMLDMVLTDYEDGFFFYYFSSSDLIGHIFYWEPEPGQDETYTDHPVRDDEDAEKYTKVLRDVYVQCDAEVGKVRRAVGDDATLFVMSDHGFMRFRRRINLNTWLLNQGFIALKDEENRRGNLNDIVDWSKTKAYSFGLNAIYLNLKGREPFGSVEPADKEAVLREITDALLSARDPEDNRPVVKTVYRTDRVYHGDFAPGGPQDAFTPDLIVGLHREYIIRLGGTGDIGSRWISDNTSEWSADHCVAAELVPGILLSNRKIQVSDPDLTDLAPTILGEFGVPRPPKMTGRNLFEPPPSQARAAKE